MRRAVLGLEFLSVLTIVLFLLSSASSISQSGGGLGGGGTGGTGGSGGQSGGNNPPSGGTTQSCDQFAQTCADGTRSSCSGTYPNCICLPCSCGDGVCQSNEQQMQCQNGVCSGGSCPQDCGCSLVRTCQNSALGTYTVSNSGTYTAGTCLGTQPSCNLCVQNAVTCEPKTCSLGGGSCVRLCNELTGQCGDCDLTCPDTEPASTTIPDPITPSVYITNEDNYQYVPATTVVETSDGRSLEVTEPVDGTLAINTPISELTLSPGTEDITLSVKTTLTTPGTIETGRLADDEKTAIEQATGNPVYTGFHIENTKLESRFQSGDVEVAVPRDFVDSLTDPDPNTAVRFSSVESDASGAIKLVPIPGFHYTHDSPEAYFYQVSLPHLSTFVIDARTTFAGPKNCNFDNNCDLAESAATCSDCSTPVEQLCTGDACFGNDLYSCVSGRYLKKTSCVYGCANAECTSEQTGSLPNTVLSLLVIITVISAGIVGFIFLR